RRRTVTVCALTRPFAMPHHRCERRGLTGDAVSIRVAMAGVMVGSPNLDERVAPAPQERQKRAVKKQEARRTRDGRREPPADRFIHGYLKVPELRRGLPRYFAFYNYARLHQALRYRTPAAVCKTPV